MFTRRIKTVAQLERELDRPVLGALPHLRVRSTGISTLAGDSDGARAARALTANVAALDESSLLVSAPAVGHGRSIVVANVAVGLAERGEATLALDFDDDGQLGRLLGAAAALDGEAVPVRSSLDLRVVDGDLGDWSAYRRIVGNGCTLDRPAFARSARSFDGVLLVVRANTLAADGLEQALAVLDGITLVGAVLTDVGDRRVAPRRRDRPTERPQPIARPRVETAPPAPVPRVAVPSPAPATWDLAALRAAVDRLAATDPGRAERLGFYVDALAEQADEQGRVSDIFGDLIRETFGELL